MPGSRSLFRLFVSSTFSDFVAEREALRRHVFPALDQMCREFGARLQVVDLRWGISDEAGRERQTIDICLGEVARCQRTTPRPNFLILLGDRYGWRPPPSRIPAADFAEFLTACAPEERDWLLAVYERDDNALPATHLLRPRETTAESRTVDVIHRVVATLGWPDGRRRPYEVSATELEVQAGAFGPPDAAEHVMCLRRSIDPAPTHRAFVDRDAGGQPLPASDALRADLASRLRERLGARFVEVRARWRGEGLSPAHLGRLPAAPDSRQRRLARADPPRTVCDAVWRGLAPIVLDRCLARAQPDALAREAEAHDAFRRERGALVLGRDALLDELVQSSTTTPGVRVIVGEPGTGKSTLMAALVDRIQARTPGPTVIARFIGATARSTAGATLIADLAQAVGQACGIATGVDDGGAYDDAVRALLSALEAAPPDRNLVVLVDALDQLGASDRARNLAWIPHRLPPHVRVFVSTASPELANLLRRKLPASSFVTVPPLPPATSRALLHQWLAMAGRRLTAEQARNVDAVAEGSGMPLHLRLLFEEVRRWRSFEALPAGSDGRAGVPGTLADAVDDLLWRLSQPSSHGDTLVIRALGYLCSARHGLADDEILEVLSRDADVMEAFRRRSPKSPPTDRLPDIVWSRLFFDLEPYLTEREASGGPTWSFFHQQIGGLIAERVCGGDEALRRHRHLADYFLDQPVRRGRDDRSLNLRRLGELPWHLARARDWAGLTELVTDWAFLEAQVSANGPAAAVADLDLALEGRDALTEADVAALEHLRSTLKLAAHVLTRDPGQLRAQLFARIDRPAGPRLDAMLDRAFAEPGTWLCPGPSFWKAGGPVVSTVVAHGARVTGVALTRDGATAVTCSEDGTVKVWDVARETERFVLSTGDGPLLSVVLTSDDTTIVAASASGVISVWDLTSGALRHRWPGLGDGRALAISKDGGTLLSGTGSHELLVVDAMSGALRRTLTLQGSGAAWLAWSDDERRLMVGGVYDSVSVLRMPDAGVERELYHGDDRWVSGLAMTADGRTGVSGDWDGNLFVWDLETGERRLRLTGYRYNERVTAVALTPDGRFVVTASNRARLQVHDLTALDRGNLAAARSFGTGPHKITHIAITPDGTRAISAAEDATIRIWDLTSTGSTNLSAEPDPFADEESDGAVDIADDGRRTFQLGRPEAADALLGAHPSASLQVQVRDASVQSTEPGTIPVRVEELRHEDDAPVEWVVTAGGNGPRRLPLGRAVTGASSADGRWLACATRENALAVWDVSAGSRACEVPLPAPGPSRIWTGIASLVLTTDGRFAVAITDDGAVLHLDARSGTLVRVQGPPASGALRLTSDDQVVAAFCGDQRLRIWTVHDMHERASFKVPAGVPPRFVGEVACWLSPDGRLWRVDLATQRRLSTPAVRGRTVALLQRGRYLAARSEEGVRVWDGATGRTLARLPVAAATACALSLDAGVAVVADGNLSLWDLRARRLSVLSGDAPFVSCRFVDDETIEAGYANGGRHQCRLVRHPLPATT